MFVGLTPVDDKLLNPMPWKPTHGYSNEQVKKYNEVLKEFVDENDLVFVDVYDLFEKGEYKKLLSDGLHPNNDGHELIYEQILEKLQELNLVE